MYTIIDPRNKSIAGTSKKYSVAIVLFIFLFLSIVSAHGQVIISQVYEGASNDKWIEITNVGSSAVNLSSPQLKLAIYSIGGDAGNGAISGSPSNILNLSGTINPGQVILYKNSSASNPSYASTTLSNNTVNAFNGNDALAIVNNSNVVLDAFGVGINSKDKSYHRVSTVTTPNAAFDKNEWETRSLAEVNTAAVNTTERLGYHSFGSSLEPAITQTGSLSAFSTTLGNPSAAQFFKVSGTNLTADITITAPAHFQVSKDGVSFATALTFAQVSGEVAQSDVYVRYNPSALGSHSGTITLESTGATTKTMAVSGATTVTKVEFTESAKTVGEGAGTVLLTLKIANPSFTHSTSVDVVLKTGDAADVGNYTTATVMFEAGSATDQTVTVTITDDALIEGIENIEFELANISGGDVAEIGTTKTLKLTILDNDLPNIFINEFHYDNTGGDTDEFVEIAVPYTFTDFNNVTLSLYNGNGGATYDTHSLSSFTSDDKNYGGFKIFHKLISGIQNGNPDGLALDYHGTILQFISYGGTFTATNGPASGMLSTDVGVIEESSSPVGSSIYLTGPNGSSWALQTTGDTRGLPNTNQVLPIELISFTATYVSGNVLLQWVTASEDDNSHFIVERSTDGLNFATLETINGAGTTSIKRLYKATDQFPLNGTAYYRLKQVDFDGMFSYSNLVAVEAIAKAILYPNPATDYLVLALSEPAASGSIKIYNVLGQEVMRERLVPGETKYKLNVADLLHGTYFLTIELPGQVLKYKFVKQ